MPEKVTRGVDGADRAIAWFEGEYRPLAEAKVGIMTHAFLYGTATFEGIRAYETKRGPAVFRLTDHMERLYRSAQIYLIDIPYRIEELIEAPVTLLSTSPEREDTILMKDPFAA